VSDDEGTDVGGAPGPDPSDGDSAGRGPLDVFFFAPVGVALTVAEDLPGLIEKGRQRVEQEISNARVLGQFVVTAGQKDLARRLGRLFGSDTSGGGTGDAGSGARADTDGPADGAAADDDRWPSTTAAPKPAPDPADQAVVERTFAGYDTLSASQVVRRQENLDAGQLGAVHRYEASHRNRRTILNRTQQLIESQAAAPGEAAAASDPLVPSDPLVESNGSAP
jgi:hypothetical protein